jgi:hypothetical protein
LTELKDALDALGPVSDGEVRGDVGRRVRRRRGGGGGDEKKDDEADRTPSPDPQMLRRSSRPRAAPSRLAEALEEETVREFEQAGWDLSEYESEPRTPRFEPERVIGFNVSPAGEFLYFVQWVGYCAPTWEPADNLAHLRVTHQFWLDYWVRSQDQMREMMQRLAETTPARGVHRAWNKRT